MVKVFTKRAVAWRLGEEPEGAPGVDIGRLS